MPSKKLNKLSMLFALVTTFCVTASAEFTDVTVKIKNHSDQTIRYLIDNFKYLDDIRDWNVLARKSSVVEDISYTSKWGFLTLEILDEKYRKIYSYTPTGNNIGVTITIENTANPGELKVTRQRGLRE